MADSTRAAQAQAEHEAILAALLVRDAQAAEALMRNHIQGAHRLRLRQFRKDDLGEQML